MAELAILAAIEVGLAVTSYFLTPKPKQQPLDKGRLDDLRFQTAEEGGTRPKCYGLDVRLAGNVIDGSRTKEFKTTTPGRTGGKGGGGGPPAEPPTTHFTYKKTFAIEFCEGPILSFLELKEDDQVIYNLAPPDLAPSYYEAEAPGNTLAGGAIIVSDTTLVSRRKVNLPPAASIQFNTVPIDQAGNAQLVIYYQSTVSAAATVRINGVDDYPITLPSTSGALGTYVLDVAMSVGNNTVKITNNHGSATISIDQIFAFRLFVDDVTGVVDPINPYPGDLNDPGPFYNYAPYREATGVVSGNFANAGQAAFELYLGTEDQLQSPTLVALHGAANTPAYRGIAYLVANQYTLKNENGGRLGNITARVQPALSDLADVLTDMYLDRGADAAELNFAALAGITVDRGFVVNRRSPLSDYVDPLMLWYNFDLVPTGGTIKAVLRGGASVVTIPESKLSAHEEGSERPAGPVAIDHLEESDIPGSVDVLYVDAAESKEFHTSSQHVEREVGNSLDPETLNFPIISDKDTAKAVGKRWLYEQVVKAKPLEFSTGPEYRHLIPTDVITLPLAIATYILRITSRQASFAGLVKFKAVPEKAAIYTQVGVGAIGSGSEIPPVRFPPNSFLWLGDIPSLRLEDDELGYYVAVCPRGTGHYRGTHLYKELVPDNYDRITGFDRAATMGVITSNVAAFTGDPSIFDRNTTITIDLFQDDGLITSRTEAEILGFPVNVLVIGSGAGGEIIQFATATPQAASAPYVARYQLSNLLRGRLGTENGALAGHSAGKTGVFLSDEVKFRHESPQELNTPRNFKAVSVGQLLADAPVTSFTLEGYSKKHWAPTNARKFLDSLNTAYFQWMRRGRQAGNWRDFADVPLSDEEEIYEIEVFNGANVVRTVRVSTREVSQLQWAPGGYLRDHVTFANDGTGTASHIPVVGYAGGSTIFSRQTISGPFFLEFEVYTAAGVTWNIPNKVMFEPAQENPPAGSNLGFWNQAVPGTYGVNKAMPQTLNAYIVDAVSGDKFAMEYRDGLLSYYKNRVLVYSTMIPQAFAPYWIRVHFDGTTNQALKNPQLIRRTTPEWVYPADLQTADGLTPGNPIHLKIYQVSSLVGRGFPLDVTL